MWKAGKKSEGIWWTGEEGTEGQDVTFLTFLGIKCKTHTSQAISVSINRPHRQFSSRFTISVHFTLKEKSVFTTGIAYISFIGCHLFTFHIYLKLFTRYTILPQGLQPKRTSM